MSDALLRLDDRVLRISARRELLRTREGWTRMASRWWTSLAFALLLGVVAAAAALAGSHADFALQYLPIFGVLCYRAGRVKSEWERLQGRGYFEERRPEGL